MDDAPSWAGQGWKDPCLNSSPEKLYPGQSAQNSQGTCPMVSATSPADGDSLPLLWSGAGVSKCAKSHPELLAINEAPFICCIYKMTKNFVAFDLPNVTIPLTALTE